MSQRQSGEQDGEGSGQKYQREWCSFTTIDQERETEREVGRGVRRESRGEARTGASVNSRASRRGI